MNTTKDWTKPNDNDEIDVPDELMPLFNQIGTQIRLHTISGKNEILTVAHCVRNAQKFFQSRISELEAENKRLIEQHRWIPVTERLPEDEGIYLVLCPKYVEDPIVARWNNERWFDNEVDFHQDITDRITHWMVIPQPPKEQ